MPPVPITTFTETYQAYKNFYIANNGSNKFEKVYDEITSSSKIQELFKWSVNYKTAPSSRDILITIHSMRYFIFAKNTTRAMGALIAWYYWNEVVNKKYNFIIEQDLTDKIKAVFGHLSMLY